jgi:hypothetical protein
VCLALGGLKMVLDVVFAILRAGGLSWSLLLMPIVSTSALILVLAGIQILLIGMLSDAVARKMGQQAPSPSLSGIASRRGSRMAADVPDRSGSGR